LDLVVNNKYAPIQKNIADKLVSNAFLEKCNRHGSKDKTKNKNKTNHLFLIYFFNNKNKKTKERVPAIAEVMRTAVAFKPNKYIKGTVK